MSEEQLQQAVIDMAHTYGWMVAHFRAAQTAKGWSTPVSADGKGFPDLTLALHGQVIFAELKSEMGKMSKEQCRWQLELMPWECASQKYYIWRPSDWMSGEIERVLRSTL